MTSLRGRRRASPEPDAADAVYVSISSFAARHQVAGEPIDVGINVANTGTVASGPFEVVWEAGGSTCTAVVGGLASPAQAETPSAEHPLCLPVCTPGRLYSIMTNGSPNPTSRTTSSAVTIEVAVAASRPARPRHRAPPVRPMSPSEPIRHLGDRLRPERGRVHRPYTTRFLLDGQLVCSVDRDRRSRQPRCTPPGSAREHM